MFLVEMFICMLPSSASLHKLHQVRAMDCVAVLTRKNAFLSSVFFLATWKWEGEYAKM